MYGTVLFVFCRTLTMPSVSAQVHGEPAGGGAGDRVSGVRQGYHKISEVEFAKILLRYTYLRPDQYVISLPSPPSPASYRDLPYRAPISDPTSRLQ